MLLVLAPAIHRGLIDRLPHLGDAGGADMAFGLMRFKAGFIPLQAAVVEQGAGLVLVVGHQLLVLQLIKGSIRQHLAPVVHEQGVVATITADLGQVVALMLTLVEQAGETGQAGVHRVPLDVDDLGVGQHQMDEPHAVEVGRHLVGDAPGLRVAGPQASHILLAQGLQLLSGNAIKRPRIPRALPGPGLVDQVEQVGQFAAAVHQGMAGDDLLGERRAGAGHA